MNKSILSTSYSSRMCIALHLLLVAYINYTLPLKKICAVLSLSILIIPYTMTYMIIDIMGRNLHRGVSYSYDVYTIYRREFRHEISRDFILSTYIMIYGYMCILHRRAQISVNLGNCVVIQTKFQVQYPLTKIK